MEWTHLGKGKKGGKDLSEDNDGERGTFYLAVYLMDICGESVCPLQYLLLLKLHFKKFNHNMLWSKGLPQFKQGDLHPI